MASRCFLTNGPNVEDIPSRGTTLSVASHPVPEPQTIVLTASAGVLDTITTVRRNGVMDTRLWRLGSTSRLLLFSFVALFGLNGCATTNVTQEQFAQKWNGRIGNFTYEDIVRIHGTPDSKESFPDGTYVAVWTLYHSHTDPAYTRIYSTSPYEADAITTGGGTTQIPEIATLTFNKNNILIEWHDSLYKEPRPKAN